MLFGKNFTKQATIQWIKSRLSKSSTFPRSRNIFIQPTIPEVIKTVVGEESRVAPQGSTHSREAANQVTLSAIQHRTKSTETIYFTLSKHKSRLSPYFKFKCNIALNKKDKVTSLHAGRIIEFIKNWIILTQDPWVLQKVQGFQLHLTSVPFQLSSPPQM